MATTNTVGSLSVGGTATTVSTSSSSDHPSGSRGNLARSHSIASIGMLGVGGGRRGGRNGVTPLTYGSLTVRTPGGTVGSGVGGGGTGTLDPRSYLSPLNDTESPYASVARSCVSLGQFAGSGCSSSAISGVEEQGASMGNTVPRVLSSTLLHEAEYAAQLSAAIRSLCHCASEHSDRRCRILACKTVALLARASYGRLKFSTPIELYSTVPGATTSSMAASNIEDELASDVPITLMSAMLEDEDDGVSACAIEALGMLVLDANVLGSFSNKDVSGENPDPLMSEVASIAFGATAIPRGKTFGGPETFHRVLSSELRQRVYENVVRPRLRRLLHRVSCFRARSCQVDRTLPLLVDAIVYFTRSWPRDALAAASPDQSDRSSYLKRWYELDLPSMVDDFVLTVLLPCMSDVWASCSAVTPDSVAVASLALGHASSLAVLRILHANPSAPWADRCNRLAIRCLLAYLMELHLDGPNQYETRAATMAAIVVALRSLPLQQRFEPLLHVLEELKSLPSTDSIPPSTVGSAGLLLDDASSIRRPIRVGLLTEVAISVILSKPESHSFSSTEDNCIKSNLLRDFLANEVVTSMLSSRSQKSVSSNGEGASTGGASSTALQKEISTTDGFLGTSVADELVLTFCTVSLSEGKRLLLQSLHSHFVVSAESWLRCAIAILGSFAGCLEWTARHGSLNTGTGKNREIDFSKEDESVESSLTLFSTSKKTYMELFRVCLHFTGLLSPQSSVSTTILPPLLRGSNQSGVAIDERLLNGPAKEIAREDLSKLIDHLVEHSLKELLDSRYVRAGFLALVSDYVVQRLRMHAKQRLQPEESSLVHAIRKSGIESFGTRKVLSTITSELSALTQQSGTRGGPGQDDEGANLQLMDDLTCVLICIACIENIALAALELDQLPGSNDKEDFRKEAEESSYLLSEAMKALKAHCGTDTRSDEKALMISEIESAASRIEHAIAVRVLESPKGSQSSPLVFRLANTPKPLMELSADLGMITPPIEPKGTSTDLKEATYWWEEQLLESLMLYSYDNAYLLQLYKQIISFRVGKAVSAAFPPNRLDIGGGNKSNDIASSPKLGPASALSLKGPTEIASQWPRSFSVTSGTSDPVCIMMSYVPRRLGRHDGEDERNVAVTVKAVNLTSVAVTHGMRLDLSIVSGTKAPSDIGIVSWGIEEHEGLSDSPFTESTVVTTVFKHEIKPLEHIVWTVLLDRWVSGPVELHLSMSFRDVEMESSSWKWVGLPARSQNGNGALTNVNEGDESGDDNTNDEDFSAAQESIGGGFFDSDQGPLEEEDDVVDVAFSCPSIEVSAFIVLQPCPLVFFRFASGDETAFWFLWFSMPHRVSKVLLIAAPDRSDSVDGGDALRTLCTYSKVALTRVSPDGTQHEAWAFVNWSGRRVLCVLNHVQESSDAVSYLQVRGDDVGLLKSLLGTAKVRREFVNVLTEGQWLMRDGNSSFEL